MNPLAKKNSNFRNINIAQIIRYRLPIAGKLSILHRASGILLFILIPLFILPTFEMSLISESGYFHIAECFKRIPIKLLSLIFVWAYLHHLFAGIRYLFLDLHIGVSKDFSCKSARLVFFISLFLTILLGFRLFWT